MELYEQVLEAGINVVTTADWVTGHHRNTNHRRNGTTESEFCRPPASAAIRRSTAPA